MYLGLEWPAYGGIEIVTDAAQATDFTTPGNYYKGRILYEHFPSTGQGELRWDK
ncbi:MAG: hypothetical protein ACKPKO_41000 [Candidatus Fonsibacter sp.]